MGSRRVDRYEVFLRDPVTDHRWSIFFWGVDFASAEDKALRHLNATQTVPDQIIKIEKDFDAIEGTTH